MTPIHTSPVDTQAELDAYIASLPVDNEPLSPEDVAAIEDGRAAAARGDVISGGEMAVRIAVLNAVESPLCTYFAQDLLSRLVEQSDVPSDTGLDAFTTILKSMVEDEMLASNGERYWQHGLEYVPAQ